MFIYYYVISDSTRETSSQKMNLKTPPHKDKGLLDGL